MAYWGVAMTLPAIHWHPRHTQGATGRLGGGREGAGGGRRPSASVTTSTPSPPSTRTQKSSDHRARALAYEKAMEQVAARYPDDREAGIFYALALNITLDPNDKAYTNQLKAAAILEKVFAERPNHPGVAHYLIHSYDFPPIAARAQRGPPLRRHRALGAARAAHALAHLHAPGHWKDSVDTNLASAAAAKDHGNGFTPWTT